MELWRQSWREDVAPRLSRAGLEAILEALRDDDERLIQDRSAIPHGRRQGDWQPEYEVEAACAIGLAAWLGDGIRSVGEVIDYVSRFCGNRAGGDFVEWYDSTQRADMRRFLLPEVRLSLRNRKESHP